MTRRSVLVNVPSFSAKDAAGRTTSALTAVSVMKMSMTTRNSAESSDFSTWERLGSETMGFSPMMIRPFTLPCSSAFTISTTVSPGLGESGLPQAFSNFSRTASTATCW